MKPRIFDPSFRYTTSVDTDISKTFARERKRMAEELKRKQAIAQEAKDKTLHLKRGPR